MRAAVFVKQVPDLRAGSVAMRPDGTIDRAAAPAIVNPADLHALEAAVQVADEVVAVSMGPPAAEAAVRAALARGASEGVLVTDRAFAGSDTWATANVLAAAVDALGGFDLVLCGLTALDGETGQVGPQVAERLGIPQATGVEHLDVDGGRVRARRVVEGGYEVVELPLPGLVTVTETGYPPHYPTLPGRRRAARAAITRLGAAELGLGPDRAGLEASPTKVAHMESVPLPAVETRFVGNGFGYDDLVASLRARGTVEPAPAREEHVAAAEPVAPRPGPAGVWVVGEVTGGRLAAVSAELLTRARVLADELDTGVAAFVAGAGIDAAVADAAAFGADAVLAADHPRLEPYRTLPHARVLADVLARFRPQVVLVGATSTGRDLAPRVAARLDTGLAADCTGLHVAGWQRRGRRFPQLLNQVRPAMGSSVLATCVCPVARPQMATVRPGVFAAVAAPRRSRVVRVPVVLPPADLAVAVLDRTTEPADVSLAEAAVIVAGGAGCSAESWHLVRELAAALGGKVAASRAAVDAGRAPRALQVGQTGTTVRPDLYVACGISGAFQHVVGMRAARTVVAINRDPDAAMFRFAHFGIVADVAEALPRLTAALRGGQ